MTIIVIPAWWGETVRKNSFLVFLKSHQITLLTKLVFKVASLAWTNLKQRNTNKKITQTLKKSASFDFQFNKFPPHKFIL